LRGLVYFILFLMFFCSFIWRVY